MRSLEFGEDATNGVGFGVGREGECLQPDLVHRPNYGQDLGGGGAEPGEAPSVEPQ